MTRGHTPNKAYKAYKANKANTARRLRARALHRPLPFATALALTGGLVLTCGVAAADHRTARSAARGCKNGCAEWRFVRPQAETAELTLGAVTFAAPHAGWATGSRAGRPALLSWNGSRWRAEEPAVPGDTSLDSVSAISATDAWAVGHRPDGTAAALRWNGIGWRPVPMARTGPAVTRDVDARTADDVWIAGASGGFAGTMAGTWHWDGRTLRAVPVNIAVDRSAGGLNSELAAVSAISKNDAWAVGVRGGGSGRELIVHWDGRSWRTVPAPMAHQAAGLADVVALSADDVWAVGVQRPTEPVDPAGPARNGGRGEMPLAEHWDGHTWARVPVPGVRGRFRAVASDGAGGIWAGGEDCCGRPLLAHWTAAECGWTFARAPVPAASGAEDPAGLGVITGLADVPGTRYLWAVGSYATGLRSDGRRYAITWTNTPRPR